MPNNAVNPAPNTLTNSGNKLNPDLQQAIEQASAPNLTQSERVQKLLASVTAPILQVYAREHNACNNVDPRIVAIQDFQKSPGYKDFKAIVENTLKQLDAIANSSPHHGQKTDRFQRFGKEVFVQVTGNQRSRFGTSQADLFEQSCPDANRLLRMHTFAKKRPDLVARGGVENARACITELSQRLDVCGPGLVQHFDEAVKTIRQLTFVPSMPERVEALRIQIVRNAITEFLNRPGAACKTITSEVHQVAAWQNHFSSMFDLPSIQDVYANANFTENESEQVELASKLSALQSGSVISTMLANQILEEAQDIWNQAKAVGINDLSQYCMTLLEKINERHGQVEPHTLMQLDDDGMPGGIQNDPTLLALSILERTDQASGVHFVKESLLKWTPSHQNAYDNISFKSRGKLNWLETAPPPGSTENPEVDLISAEGMSRQQVTELLDALFTPESHELDVRRAIHEVMQNDWGQTWPAIKSKTYDESRPEDVFVNLAFGMTHDQKLGPCDLKTKFNKLMTKALENFEQSTVLDQYTENEILELLEYVTDWNTRCEQPQDRVDLTRLLTAVRYNHQTSKIPLYKAVHRHEWKHNYDLSFRKSYEPAQIRGKGTTHALAYIEAMADGAPHLLGRTLRRNAPALTDPKVVFKFIEMGANLYTIPREGANALERLIGNRNDDFVRALLEGLVQRKYSIKDIASASSIQALRTRGMTKTSAYLDRFCDNRPLIPSRCLKPTPIYLNYVGDIDHIAVFNENRGLRDVRDFIALRSSR